MESKKIRKLIIDAAFHARHGHVPSALSIVDILVALDNKQTVEDDFILSKGHGCLAYYAYLAAKGTISIDELRNFGKRGSNLGGHPDKNKVPGIFASTGSLGHGLPIAVGAAIAKKILKQSGKIYCLIGDGESNEGTVWESCLVAARQKLNNLICIVDNNKSQTRSLPTSNLVNKFKSFGWKVWEVDGHDHQSLLNAFEFVSSLSTDSSDQPTVIIANTIKGKGIKDIENDMFAWHHRAPNELEYKKFIEEINEK
jgi:transketolase